MKFLDTYTNDDGTAGKRQDGIREYEGTTTTGARDASASRAPGMFFFLLFLIY